MTVAARGDYSAKPRLALVVQADLFTQLQSVTVCLISTGLVNAPLLRLTVEPTRANGLFARSQIMIDKIVTVPREKIGTQIRVMDREILIRVDRSLALFLGVA